MHGLSPIGIQVFVRTSHSTGNHPTIDPSNGGLQEQMGAQCIVIV